MKLTKLDYVTILKHYGIKIPQTQQGKPHLTKMKSRVRTLLVEKLCRCIKAVQKSKSKKYKERVAIAICDKSIFKNRKLHHYRFTCKKKKRLYRKKGSRVALSKTGKIIFQHPTRKKRKRRKKNKL